MNRDKRTAILSTLRVSNQTGIATGKTRLEVEKRLPRLTPERFLEDAPHWLMRCGRYIRKARKPLRGECRIEGWSEYRQKVFE